MLWKSSVYLSVWQSLSGFVLLATFAIKCKGKENGNRTFIYWLGNYRYSFSDRNYMRKLVNLAAKNIKERDDFRHAPLYLCAVIKGYFLVNKRSSCAIS